MATTSESTANSTVTSATADGDTEREQEHGNGATAAPAVVQQEEEGEELIGPGPAPARQRQKRPLQFEQAFLDALPSAAMCVFSSSPFSAIGFACVCFVEQWLTVAAVAFCRYEKSYMHRDVVTHVAVSPSDFFITGSADGNFLHTVTCFVRGSVFW